MKKTLNFEDFLVQTSKQPRKLFVPRVYYNEIGNILEFQSEDCAAYHEHINPYITIIRKMYEPEKEKIIGVNIYSIKQLLKLGGFKIVSINKISNNGKTKKKGKYGS